MRLSSRSRSEIETPYTWALSKYISVKATCDWMTVHTVDASGLYDGTENHDDVSDEHGYTSTIIIRHPSCRERSKDSTEREDCVHDPKKSAFGTSKIW